MGEFMNPGELLDMWAAQLPARKFLPDGQESLASKCMRAAIAYQHQQRLEQDDPSVRVAREAKSKERDAAERAQRSDDMNHRFYWETPKALERMGLDAMEVETIGGLEEREVCAQAFAWWKGSGKLFLTIGGKPGTGKTIAGAHLLKFAATELVSCESVEGYRWDTSLAKFIKAQEIGRMSLYGREVDQRLQRLKLVGLLVIDDLGTESKSDGFGALFEELIDGRARNKVRTVVTTNLTGAEMTARYGVRLMRRLKDFGAFIAATERFNVNHESSEESLRGKAQ